jgi:hypothetical protein
LRGILVLLSITSSYNDASSGDVWAYTMTEITEEEYNKYKTIIDSYNNLNVLNF